MLPAALMGFALGGFFDGILLHQILQWHHLLSAVDLMREDLALQILADGVFHALMYVIAAVGLIILWQRREDLVKPGAGGTVLGGGLIGFAIWHVVDALVFHWLLGLHRIRMDTPVPLAWDLAWLAIFGIAVGALGLFVLRKASTGPGRHARGVAFMLAFTCLACGAVAGRTQPGDVVIAIYPANPTGDDIAAALVVQNAALIGSDRSGRVWLFKLNGAERRRVLPGFGIVAGGIGWPAFCAGSVNSAFRWGSSVTQASRYDAATQNKRTTISAT